MKEVCIARPHVVIYVAVEVEFPDGVIRVKDAKLRVPVVRVRCPVDVKFSGTDKLSRNVEFQRFSGLPSAPQFTILLGHADLEPNRGR